MTARTIMIQGTGSHVGKSYLTAGLCRLFRDNGWRVAPFKAQNMALNSYATADGREIGWAQAIQAKAAGLEPAVDMNPILLKPSGQMESQVILNGRSQGKMEAQTYLGRQRDWSAVWKGALSRLREQYELVVIEGAGSPAEINLLDRDFANMGVAEEAGAPVLLVGDIDRGGVFASLYGTYALLPQAHRERLAGFIINKFRGEATRLSGGLEYIEQRTDLPVLGVVPYMDVWLEEEDSVALEGRLRDHDQHTSRLRVAIPRFPAIANFTDFHRLDSLPEVDLVYVDDPARLRGVDAVILPGSKSTLADLRWLKSKKLDVALIELVEAGRPVIGICGGYQMLGEIIRDPSGVEGPGADSESGLGLLAIETELRPEKSVRRTGLVAVAEGLVGLDVGGGSVTGYEIHAGVTRAIKSSGHDTVPWIEESGDVLGHASTARSVAGSYIHGLFDNQRMIESFLHLLADRAGISRFAVGHDDFEPRIDKIAAVLRDNLDMERIQELVEGGVGWKKISV